MATDAENLVAIRSGILAALAEDALNPKPDYAIGGQSVTRSAWRTSLMQQLKDLNALADSINGPWEVAVQGLP